MIQGRRNRTRAKCWGATQQRTGEGGAQGEERERGKNAVRLREALHEDVMKSEVHGGGACEEEQGVVVSGDV